MKTQNVKQGIQDLARENYRLYSDGYSYRPEGGELDEREKEVAKDVADGYFENRNESEIERDDKLEITEEDYRRWVLEEIEKCAKEKAEV